MLLFVVETFIVERLVVPTRRRFLPQTELSSSSPQTSSSTFSLIYERLLRYHMSVEVGKG